MNDQPKEAGVKERIMNAATRLFYQQGYRATGINQIIEEAQIAKSSLYQHFASKDLLLDEYLLSAKDQWIEDLTAFTANLPEGREKLLAFFDFRRRRLEQHEFKGCTFSRVIYELPNLGQTSADIIRNHKSTLRAFITTQLRAIKDPYPEADLEEMTDLLFNLSEGAVLHSTLFNNSKPLEDAKKTVGKLLKTI
jgi:AcrR family transcriptional regulator